MIKEFLEGETYAHPKYNQDIMVLGIGEENDAEVVLAILWVEREGRETTGFGELVVKKSEFKDWELADL